jgi:hypothetical protein
MLGRDRLGHATTLTNRARRINLAERRIDNGGSMPPDRCKESGGLEALMK